MRWAFYSVLDGALPGSSNWQNLSKLWRFLRRISQKLLFGNVVFGGYSSILRVDKLHTRSLEINAKNKDFKIFLNIFAGPITFYFSYTVD